MEKEKTIVKYNESVNPWISDFMSIYTKALKLAEKYHNDQVDKNGEPYIFHLLRVSANC